MEQALLVSHGIIITLMLYLDRGRRADNAQTRKEIHVSREEARADNAQARKEARSDNAQLRQDMETGFNRVNKRIDKLTDILMDLCRRVGRLEGHAEASANPDQ